MIDRLSNLGYDRILPSRRSLGHSVPPWVEEDAVFFVTIGCAERGRNQLAYPEFASLVSESLDRRRDLGQWWVLLFLLMPDHAHALVSFGRGHAMSSVIADWKRFIARRGGVAWQRDFFDHRIRGYESLEEKHPYIRQNPVRAGLVTCPEDWPYVWTHTR